MTGTAIQIVCGTANLARELYWNKTWTNYKDERSKIDQLALTTPNSGQVASLDGIAHLSVNFTFVSESNRYTEHLGIRIALSNHTFCLEAGRSGASVGHILCLSKSCLTTR